MDVNRYGRLVEIGIETETFDRYIIENGKVGRELFDYLFYEVSAEGHIVGQNTEGIKIIHITQYGFIRKGNLSHNLLS